MVPDPGTWLCALVLEPGFALGVLGLGPDLWPWPWWLHDPMTQKGEPQVTRTRPPDEIMVEIFPEELTLRPSAFFGGFWFKDAEFEPIMDSCLRFSLTLIYTQPQTWACQ